MQIIDREASYVSRDDLVYLEQNDSKMPLSLQQGLKRAIANGEDYVRIEDPKGVEYIFEQDLYLFDDLMDLSIPELYARIQEIVLEDVFEDPEGIVLTDEEKEKLKRTRQYLIRQLMEMIYYKTGSPVYNYPDVPVWGQLSATNGRLVAHRSYSPGKVLVEGVNGEKIESIDEKDEAFCLDAYMALRDDPTEQQDDPLLVYTPSDIDMSSNGRYFVIQKRARMLQRKIEE